MQRPRLLPVTIFVLVACLGGRAAGLVAALRGGRHLAGLVAAAAAAPSPEAAPGSTPPAAPAAGTHVAAASIQTIPGQFPTDDVKPENPPLGAAPISEAERALLLSLRQRRAELDAREAQIAQRERLLAAGAHRLDGRLDQLAALQARIQALQDARRQQTDAGWSGLVSLYQTMKPADAAAILNDLDMAVLLPIVDRMNGRKAAAILAAMDPAKARKVTDGLARLHDQTDPARPADGL